MKILVVSGEYPPMNGGVGRYTKNLVHAIAKKPNVEVSVAIGGGGGEGGSATAPITSDPSPDRNNVTVYHNVVRKGDKRNSERILQIVSETKPDVVNIQYERGLYEIDTTIRHTFWRLMHGSTLDRFYKMSPVPTVSTLHTVFPQDEILCLHKRKGNEKGGQIWFPPSALACRYKKMGNEGAI